MVFNKGQFANVSVAAVPVLVATTKYLVAPSEFSLLHLICYIVSKYALLVLCVCVISTHVHIHVHVDEILVWTGVSRAQTPPVTEISYAAEYCILKPLILYCSIAMVVNTQETYTDRCQDAFPQEWTVYIYIYIVIVHIL